MVAVLQAAGSLLTLLIGPSKHAPGVKNVYRPVGLELVQDQVGSWWRMKPVCPVQ